VTDVDVAPPNPSSPTRDLRLIAHQVRYEQIAFWRNRFGALFTVGFSTVFLILLGASAGKSRVSYLNNIRLIAYYVPGFIAYGVMAACFTTLAISLVVRRETGLMKRLRLSPLPTWVLLGSIFVSTLIVALVQVVLLLTIGHVLYHVQLPQAWLALLVTLAVGVLSFASMGAAMSTLVPNEETAGPATSIVFFVLLFLSGLWFPLDPKSGLSKLADYFPIRHFISAVRAPFEFTKGASPWAWHDLIVVAIWGVLAAALAARRFDWAPRRK
jgi:ABC-2 type transport system permease protein